MKSLGKRLLGVGTREGKPSLAVEEPSLLGTGPKDQTPKTKPNNKTKTSREGFIEAPSPSVSERLTRETRRGQDPGWDELTSIKKQCNLQFAYLCVVCGTFKCWQRCGDTGTLHL